jgi:hypothetical protein
MLNKFAVVGISGLVVCVACLAAAAAIGGKELLDSGFDFGGFDRPRCDVDSSNQSGAGSRSIAWNGGDKVEISLPANVHYRPGSGDQVVVTGDSAILPHVRVKDGNIKLDCRGGRIDRLDVTLPGRAFRTFALAGSGSMTLNGIDQPDLKIRLAGSGDIVADGKTDNLDLKIAGSGDAKLGDLAANDVSLSLAGSSDVEVAPKGKLDVSIAGSGKVVLRTEPHDIETHIAGSGRIVHPTSP